MICVIYSSRKLGKLYVCFGLTTHCLLHSELVEGGDMDVVNIPALPKSTDYNNHIHYSITANF